MSAPIPLSPSFVSLSTADDPSNHPCHDPPTPKVRFDHACVLIPDALPTSRLPRLVTKSYSLPLWKRKRAPSVVSESESESSDDHVVFKVSVPSIVTKARSPSRGDAARMPLVSCLVHADPSTSSSPPRVGRPRRASLPAPVHPDAVTVPLRPCCSQCYPSIDNCMKEGDHWKVHFSRGALRRRKSVSDVRTPSHARHCVRDAMPGFDAIVAVDEVERRRKSTEIDPLTALTLAMSSTSVATSSGSEEIPLRRALSLPDAVHPRRAKLIPDVHPSALSPPILEEDELRPSPRRTPIASPLGSTTNLPSLRTTTPLSGADMDKSTADYTPATVCSYFENTPLLELDSILSSSPPTVSRPVPTPERETESSYFPAIYSSHPRGISLESPSSSASSSPILSHAHSRSTSALESPGGTRKKSFQGILRASTQVFKGLSGISGVPVGM